MKSIWLSPRNFVVFFWGGGGGSVVLQIFVVTLIFLLFPDPVSRGEEVSDREKTASGSAPLPPLACGRKPVHGIFFINKNRLKREDLPLFTSLSCDRILSIEEGVSENKLIKGHPQENKLKQTTGITNT